MPYLTLGEAADKLKLSPSKISNAIYRRQLDVSRCPLLGGRRMIPADYLPQIERLLSRRGKQPMPTINEHKAAVRTLAPFVVYFWKVY